MPFAIADPQQFVPAVSVHINGAQFGGVTTAAFEGFQYGHRQGLPPDIEHAQELGACLPVGGSRQDNYVAVVVLAKH